MTVLYGSSVILYAGNTTGWTDDYLWSNGKKGNLIVIPNITSDRTYTVQYTNQGGSVTLKNFTIKIISGVQSIVVDGKTYKNQNKVMVNQGQNVQLSIIMPEILSDGEWKWSDGSTGPAITLDNIQTSGTYSVVYTMKTGETLNFDYEILVTEKEDRMLEVADYYIIDRASNRYLTNVGGLGTSPVLAEKDETAPLKQIWNITRSTTARYDILSRLDGSGIDKSGVLRNRTFKYTDCREPQEQCSLPYTTQLQAEISTGQ